MLKERRISRPVGEPITQRYPRLSKADMSIFRYP